MKFRPLRHVETLLLAAFLLLLLGTAASRVHSFDIFWQLHTGRHILQTGEFVYRDIFSLAADAPRFEHCWLHDILFYGAYLLGGFHGVSLLKGILVAAAGGAALAVARLRGASAGAFLLLAGPALFLTRGGWLERPQLWSYLFFLLLLLLLEAYRRRQGRFIWLLPPLVALWANLHAGVVLAFPVLAAALVGLGAERLLGRAVPAGRDLRRLLLAFAATLPAALLTPYGWQTLETLLLAPSFGDASGPSTHLFNMDWRPTTFAGSPLFFYSLGIAALLLAVSGRRARPGDLFLLGGLAWMGLTLERHIPFFHLAAAALLPSCVDRLGGLVAGRLPGAPPALLRFAGLASALLVAGYFAAPAVRATGFFDTGLREWHYPVKAAEFVRAERLPANLYNTYDWGGYLMWTLYPEHLVFWDGRSDSAEMFDHGLRIMRGDSGWKETLDRFGVRTVVTKACTVDTGQRYPLIDRLRESPDWTLVFADVSALVFVRADAVDPQWLARRRLPDSRADDTVLSEAALLAEAEPRRYMAWWEIARIRWNRGDYRQAFDALEKHLSYAPEGKRMAQAEAYFRILYPMMARRQP